MTGSGRSDAVDVAALLARVRGNTVLLKKLAVLFVDNAPRMQARVHEAVTCRDEKALREAVHDLRGSVGILTGRVLGDVAGRVEELFHTGQFAEVEEACARLDTEFEKFTVALKRLL
jgi:HPt (histidine-containing phosphotransfer) domain-containing protein